MKVIHIIIVLTLAMRICNAQTNTETLTNENIITLSKIGLQSSVIITKIKSSGANYDVSTDALINLSKNNVAADVINAMMIKQSEVRTAIINVANDRDPLAMHKSGIYYYNKNDLENPVQRIDPVRVANVSSSGGGYGGFGGSTQMAHLSGPKSRLQIADANPVFYFYFDNKNSLSADWYYDASSPNEFALVKLIEKKGERLFKTGGTSSAWFSSSSQSGIPEKDKTPFQYTEVSEGIYKITFSESLPEGEFCFVFAGSTTKVITFGKR